MKVGVFLSKPLQTLGGKYTFEAEVFQSLIQYGADGGHTFVIYSRDKDPVPEILDSPHLEFQSLHRSIGKHFNAAFDQASTILVNKLRNPFCKVRVHSRLENFIYNSFLAQGVDISWSLTPSCPTKKVPYITTVWDLEHQLQPYFPELTDEGQWESREWFYTVGLRRAAYIITGTKAGKEQIERFYQVPSQRIKVLPFPTPQFVSDANPVSHEEFLKKYNIPNNYLFYPAQFWPHKNHVGLLLTVKYLREHYGLNFSAVFVGSEKGNQTYIKQLVNELNLSQQVHFLGFVPREDLVSLYRNAFALAMMTFCGPDNLPPLEAFALGCPVVASAVSGAKEQLGDAALLFDPKEPEQVANAIKLLVDQPELRQSLIERGYERASQWTGEQYIKEMLAILDEFAAIRHCWSNTEPYHQRH